jgi:DNA gyrase subunit A
VVITISQDDYIKRMHIDTFREQRRGGQGVVGLEKRKEEDSIKACHVASTHDYLLIFTSLGRCYWLKVWQIPDTGRRSKGRPLINLLEDLMPGEKIATILQVDEFHPDAYIVLATKKGVIKKSALSEFSNPRRKGIIALTIDEGDELIATRHVIAGQEVMLFTRDGMAVRFDETEVRPMGRGARGVRGVQLKDEEDVVIGCEVVSGQESILIVCENGFGKRSLVEEFRKTHRGGVGVRSIITSERNGQVAGALSCTDQDCVLLVSKEGQTIRINLTAVRVLGRNTQGVKLVNLKDDIIRAIQKVPPQEESSKEVREEEGLESSEKAQETSQVESGEKEQQDGA